MPGIDAADFSVCNAGINVGLTRLDVEGISTGLPSQDSSPGQQQSRAASDSPHKARVPIAAIAGAAAGGLVAVIIGK